MGKYIAIQIPYRGESWVEMGNYRSRAEAWDAHERNDTQTLIFSERGWKSLARKVSVALGLRRPF